MKKITLVLGVFACAFLKVNAQCTVDPSVIPSGQTFYPLELNCAERGVSYDETVQFKIPATVNVQDFYPSIPFAINISVDSLVIDSIAESDLPNGLTATWSPSSGVYQGGDNGCFNIAGTTNAPAGNYPVTVYGYIAVSGIPQNPMGIPPDTIFSLSDMAAMGNSPFNFSIDVINAGEECRPSTSIGAVSTFNATISAYPNPVSNILNVDINTAERINGTINVFDALGRNVYSEKVDIKGVVKKQIEVASFPAGIYVLQLTDAKRAYQTKFIVD